MKAATHRWRGIGVLPSCGKAKASLLAAVIVFGSFFALGCRQQALYHYHYSPEGERVPFKRVAKRMSRMTLRPWSTKAYVSGGDLKIEKISEEQKQIVEDFGVPESTRVPFESLQNETVDEWLYLRHNLLVQWVDGAKVFEGPVTDIERTLVEKGYPRTSTVSQDEYGVERQTWHYRNRPDLASQVYTFTNGELSYRRTPN